MGFINEEGIQHLTNRLVQGDAIKVASHRGHTVTNILDNITRECENVSSSNTMSLENRVNEFKVGEGRDVDVCGDVESDKIEVELQGQTYQNLIGGIHGDSNSCTSGTNVTNTVAIDDKNKTVTISRSAEEVSTHTGVYFKLNKDCIKKGSQYTLIINVTENTMPDGTVVVDKSFTGFSPMISVAPNKTGLMRHLITCEDIKNHRWWIWSMRTNKYGKITFSYPILLEGDYTQTPIEELPKYFQEIKSSFEDGIVDVKMVGKNLFDGHVYVFNSGKYIGTPNYNTEPHIKLKPNTTYTMNFETSSNDSRIFLFENGTKTRTFGASAQTTTFKTTNIENGLSFYRGNNGVAPYDNLTVEYKVQLVEGNVNTAFEPYYNKKISFNIEEPLRSLPNGTRDEIRNNNGVWELVRRIGKTVLDETFDYTLWVNTPSDGYFVCHANRYLQGDFTFSEKLKNIICDKLPVSTSTGVFRNVSFFKSNPHITVSSSEANSIPEFKEWIAKNPITLYYELETPMITTIEPIEFDIKPMANIYIKSGYIAPISSHKVILNRAGQIEQGIIRIGELRTRVSELETVYESQLLENQLKLSLMNLDYTLAKEDDI